MSQPTGPGRRVARAARSRTLGLGLALAVGAPAVTALALLVQAAGHQQEPVTAGDPETTPLTRSVVVCPSPLTDDSVAVLSAAPADADGAVEIVSTERGAQPRPLSVGGRSVAGAAAPAAPVVVRGSDGLAPGLFGSRLQTRPRPAAGECVSPVGERWFAAVGAGGFHTSRLELVNPDTGPAVADVTLWSTEGQMEAVRSRGLTIPGGRSTELNLSRIAPHRDDLVARVSVTRGRVTATMRDAFAPGTSQPPRDWISTTAPPTSADQIIPGLAPRASSRTLVLLNPGLDEARVTLQVVGRQSTFQPSGLEEIRVPAGRVVVTDLTEALARAVARDDTSLVVTSTVPVVAGLREVVEGDLVHHPAMTGADGEAAALLPPVGNRVVLVAPTELTGNFTVEFLGRGGQERAVIQARTAGVFRVPRGATGVVVRARVPYVAAVRTLTDRGASLLPLRPVVTDQLLPAVTPAWP